MEEEVFHCIIQIHKCMEESRKIIPINNEDVTGVNIIQIPFSLNEFSVQFSEIPVLLCKSLRLADT